MDGKMPCQEVKNVFFKENVIVQNGGIIILEYYYIYLNYFTGGKINRKQDRIRNLSFGDGMRVQERLCIS